MPLLVFCTAEEAKPFVRLLFPANEKSTYGLVESKQSGGTFRRAVKDDEAIETEFIGASVEDCGSWVLQQQEKNIYIEYDTLVVLDKRSNDDHTVILAFYIRDDEFLLKGQPINTWYEFRVPYQKVDTLLDTLERPSDVFGVYFHRKNELTDENGVFDAGKAWDLRCEGKGHVLTETNRNL
ncbi:hypothetical protein SUNI508_11719 [Seiridium unicorne]|uniref:Uncharacterized protein n=1 Tax=Seiridium unicorne TaxID=138068 RepID=A0ABR2UGM4_9PEZI